jgi:signal transduction histidine kinase
MEAAPVVLEALDAERARIGREIHDGPAQVLANAIFEVDDIERLVERDPAGAVAGLKQLRGCCAANWRTSASSSRSCDHRRSTSVGSRTP